MKHYDETNYRKFTTKSEAHKAFNSLLGIIHGVSLDQKINDLEIRELDKWCIHHEYLLQTNPFNEIIDNIQSIISSNDDLTEAIKDIKWLCNQFQNGFNYYDQQTSDLQILQGLCHGIIADGIITDEEIYLLNNWLTKNQHLSSFFPFDELVNLIHNILEDGIIDDNERLILKKFFLEFVDLREDEILKKVRVDTTDIQINGICVHNPYIRIEEALFSFTGKSKNHSRNYISQFIEERGGIFKNTVTKKTNFLIVGNDGNPCWSFSCYGRKVEQAIKLRKSGHNILVVHESDFWNCTN